MARTPWTFTALFLILPAAVLLVAALLGRAGLVLVFVTLLWFGLGVARSPSAIEEPTG